MKSRFTLFFLLLLSGIELYSEYFHVKEIMFFTKPSLLPVIATYFFLNGARVSSKVRKLMMGAFLFSWLGDVSLMLTPETPGDTELMGIPKNKYLFLAGLGSFLIAQLLFIFSYKNSVLSTAGKTKPVWFIPFVIYWAIMLSAVLPPLRANAEKKAAMLPVIVYASILISMAAFALWRYGRTNTRSFILTLSGACIFVVSDSLIALNFLAFPAPMEKAGFLIMPTYVAAEFLIAQGILEHFKQEETFK